jgi:hypothetical protein
MVESHPLRLKTRLKKTRQNKKIERGRDSIQSERALAWLQPLD